MRASFEVFLLVWIVQIVTASDPFTTLIAYEKNQRISAEVNDTQYHLLPFRVSGISQHFILAPQIDQFLNVEVLVNWVNNNSKLHFPQFDLKQKIRLVIEQQSMWASPKKPMIRKQFLTQTGFKLHLKAGSSYRCKIQSSGQVQKIVEIAIVNKARNATNAATKLKMSHQEEVQVLKEMSKTLQRAKQARARHEIKTSQSKVADMWAWMRGIEIVSLLGFLLVQLALFQRFMLPTSVV